jgi:hypothetical protein
MPGEPEIGGAVAEVGHEIACLLRGPGSVRLVVVPRMWTCRVLTSITKNT